MSSPGRWPHLFPPRIYELTYRMLEHAVHAELGNLVGINLTESPDTCQLIVDQCIALAECILDRRSSPPWPPTEKVIRAFAKSTVSGLENSGEKIACTGPPAATSDAVYTYLARVVVDGEPATQVFPPGESVILPAWTTAAMLVSLLPDGASTWQDHLQMIWDLETTDGVNYAALAAIYSRARRREVRPTSKKKLSRTVRGAHQPHSHLVSQGRPKHRNLCTTTCHIRSLHPNRNTPIIDSTARKSERVAAGARTPATTLDHPTRSTGGMTMRSIIAEDAQSALPIPAISPHPRLDRVAAATLEQLSAALIFLSVFEPDAFDHSMDVAQSDDDNPGATGEAEPVCAVCGSKVGIFLERGLAWRHYTGDGMTGGQQHIYDPGHTPVVTWRLSEDPPTQV